MKWLLDYLFLPRFIFHLKPGRFSESCPLSDLSVSAFKEKDDMIILCESLGWIGILPGVVGIR
jgi:hypothetical protein